MIIKQQCIGCGRCIPYCGMNAISLKDGKASIDLEACVECGVCMRSAACPVNALALQELDEMRKIRHQFSDPQATHPSTRIKGRGTEEIKTNDVTNRVQYGKLGIGVEVGRPGIGTSFRDVEHIAKAIAPIGLTWERANPIASLMKDEATGKFLGELLNERVLSCILEFTIPVEKLKPVMRALVEVQNEVDTVYSVSMISTYGEDGSLPGMKELQELGIAVRPNAKTNLGMGRLHAHTH